MKTTDTRRGRRVSPALATAAVSAAVFFAIFGGLAQQLANGHDPALATVSPTTDRTQQQARRVLLRKIHRRIIVTHVVPAPQSNTSATPSIGSAPAFSPSPAPAAPPTTTVTPAPAPAPAPVTRSS